MSLGLQPRRRGHSLFFTPVSDSTSSETATPSSTISRRKSRASGSSSQLSSSLHTAQNSAVNGSRNVYRSSSSPLIYQDPRAVYPPSSYPLGGPEGHRSLRPSHSQSHLQRSRSNSQQQQFYIRPQLVYSRDSGSDELDDDDSRPLLVTRSTHSPARISHSLVAPLSSIRTDTMVSRKSAVEPAENHLRASLHHSRSKTHSNNAKPPSVNGHKSLPLEKHAIVVGISGSSINWSVNFEQLTPLMFQCLRTLAVIPAGVETLHLLAHGNTRLDYMAAAAWSLLTAYQVLAFTTGLLNRWRHYYPIASTLIRLLALQAICWPATFYTLRFLQYDGVERPLACWAVIGTTTCITRSIQLWVTSNIDDWHRDSVSTQYSAHTVASIALWRKNPRDRDGVCKSASAQRPSHQEQ
ncbi:SubName: Full=Related to Myp1 protein {ECO:0000313/EMBL:CCA68344.1} [Serendipita indica DSM 11827]|nr:SubName: Full=Related to Myp1 protein {ECO:0000313/EMBL:CCA68344.1} [Serendipita indica DSM 11827]